MTRLQELTEMIAMGWGDTSQKNIPYNWAHRRGPSSVAIPAKPMGRRGPKRLDLWKLRRRDYLKEKSGLMAGL